MVKKIITLFLILFSFVRAEQVVEAHIFVHGTRMSFLSLVSATSAVRRKLRNKHLYTKVVKSTRKDERYQDAQVLLDRGLVELQSPLLKKCREQKLETTFSRKAAIQAVNAYDMLSPQKNIHHYYTYGWDGMLADEYRKNDGGELYTVLANLRDKLQNQYPGATIKIYLHGHSHGGNIILYLGYHENNQKRNLIIDKVLLYGTPIQAETASYCLHPMFKKIISFYSEGDTIQIADKISTATGTSSRRFADLVNIRNAPVIDVCLSAEYDRKAFGHASLFFIDMYQNGIAQARRHVFNEIKFFPVAALSPLFLPLVEQLYDKHKSRHVTVNFTKNSPASCIIEASDRQGYIVSSPNILPLLNPISHIVKTTWKPYAKNAGVINSAKLVVLDLMKQTPQHWFDLITTKSPQ